MKKLLMLAVFFLLTACAPEQDPALSYFTPEQLHQACDDAGCVLVPKPVFAQILSMIPEQREAQNAQ